MSTQEQVQKAIDSIAGFDLAAIRDLLAEHQALLAWARENLNLGYAVGDTVRITEPIDFVKAYGWSSHREVLAVGSLVVVEAIEFSRWQQTWSARVTPVECWTVDIAPLSSSTPSAPIRRWCGSWETAPEGYRKRHADEGDAGKHRFHMRASRLAPVTQKHD